MQEEDIIVLLNLHVERFNTWLEEHYSPEEIAAKAYDDTGYPQWGEVENTFELVFTTLDFDLLDEPTMQNIGYLIARQWDVGIIFPYFSAEISQLGMSEKQLLTLTKYGLTSSEWSLKQQCAASLWKVTNYRIEAIQIAQRYAEDPDTDIRRHALNTLEKLKGASRT